MKGSLREKCPNTEFFLVRIFLTNTGKYGPEKNSAFGHISRRVFVQFLGLEQSFTGGH